MTRGIKLSKSHLFKIIKIESSSGALLDKFAGPLMELLAVVLQDKDILEILATMVSASVLDGAIQRKICRQEVVRATKRITLIISNEDINDIIRIIKSLKILMY